MTYVDSHGRPELLMHPAIKRGAADWRVTGDAKAVSQRPAADPGSVVPAPTAPAPAARAADPDGPAAA